MSVRLHSVTLANLLISDNDVIKWTAKIHSLIVQTIN